MRHRRTRGAAAGTALAVALGVAPFTVMPTALAAAATEIALPVPDTAPMGIAAGPGGVWFAESSGGIGRVDGAGKVTRFAVPANSKKNLAVPDAMATASDGALWFTDASPTLPRVGRVDPATGRSTLYELPTTGDVSFASGQITGIAPGADGAMWFTGGYSGAIGKIDKNGTVTAFGTGLASYSIAVGPDGAVWFTDLGGVIGRLDPATGQVTTHTPPSAAVGNPALGEIVNGPGGRLWFTEPGVGKIGSLDPASGEFAEYAVPTADSKPSGLTVGADGKLWFTEAAASNVGSLDPATGEIAEYPLPARLSVPMRLAKGPGGKLWYTAPGRGRVGSFDPAAPPSGAAHPATPALVPGAMPNAAAAFQNQCPSGTLCQTQLTTGGKVKIGSFAQDLPSGAIRITGYIGEPDETGQPVLKPPVAGQQFVAPPIEVKGGLIGQLPLVGPVLGKTPAAMWKVNRLTVSQTLAGPIHIFVSEAGLGASAKLNIQLNNELLGKKCVIGPIEAKLAPRFLAGAPGGDPQLGWLSAQIGIDAPIAVPKARGCGPNGILDGVINQMMGLPSPASKNTMSLTGIMNLGSGVNPTNVPAARAASSSPAVAKGNALLRSLTAKRKAKPAVTKAEKVVVKVRARR